MSFEGYDLQSSIYRAKISVIGIGGAGGNALNLMEETGIQNVRLIAMNTDVQALNMLRGRIERFPLGLSVTGGLGAGGDPEVGRRAAEADKDEIARLLENTDMAFIMAGLGGGTGTGASPIVAEIAKEKGILTVAVVTKPFSFEGVRKRIIAEEGYRALMDRVDSIIAVLNDNLLDPQGKPRSFWEACRLADGILQTCVQTVSDLITVPAVINLDFADVRNIMQNAGSALIGVGSARGEGRAVEATRKAVNCPLLENASIEGARGVIICVAGGEDLEISEVYEAADFVREQAAPDAQIKFGAMIDERYDEEMRVMIVAAGFPHSTASREEIRPMDERIIRYDPQRAEQEQPASDYTPAIWKRGRSASGFRR